MNIPRELAIAAACLGNVGFDSRAEYNASLAELEILGAAAQPN